MCGLLHVDIADNNINNNNNYYVLLREYNFFVYS